MKIGYTIISITYDEQQRRFGYKYADRYNTHFQTFHETISHEECMQLIERRLRGIALEKYKENKLDRKKYNGTYKEIFVEV